jgi:hypothetical protein
MAFCRDILEPYEKMFPRRKDEIKKREDNATAENEKKVNTDLFMLVLI